MKRAVTLCLIIMISGFGFATLAPATTIADERGALIQAKSDAEQAKKRVALYMRNAATERDGAAQARAQMVVLAARVQTAEADIVTAEARTRIITQLQADQRAKLAAEQGPILRLVAALQAMARRPAIMALVQPGSTADMVHVRAVLATVMPVVQQRTAALRADVLRGRELQRAANMAAKVLHDGRQLLQKEQLALAQSEATHRRREQQYANDALFEGDRVLALGEKARDITTLMQELDAQAVLRDQLAALPGPLLRPEKLGLAVMPQAVLRPATAPRQLSYRLPVLGQVVTGLGEISASGVRAKGLTISARPNAQIVAPTRGRIAYAGEYRGYGKIVIIEHGDGWTSLITHISSLSVKVGDMVEQGSPLGRVGRDRREINIELRRNGQPADIIALVS